MVAVALEHRMRLDVDDDVQIAPRATGLARFAFAAQHLPHTGVHSRRERYLQGAPRRQDGLPLTLGTNFSDDDAATAACPAALRNANETVAEMDDAAASTLPAHGRLRARLGPGSLAGVAIVLARYGDGFG